MWLLIFNRSINNLEYDSNAKAKSISIISDYINHLLFQITVHIPVSNDDTSPFHMIFLNQRITSAFKEGQRSIRRMHIGNITKLWLKGCQKKLADSLPYIRDSNIQPINIWSWNIDIAKACKDVTIEGKKRICVPQAFTPYSRINITRSPGFKLIGCILPRTSCMHCFMK